MGWKISEGVVEGMQVWDMDVMYWRWQHQPVLEKKHEYN
jgi:hypothetical protein